MDYLLCPGGILPLDINRILSLLYSIVLMVTHIVWFMPNWIKFLWMIFNEIVHPLLLLSSSLESYFDEYTHIFYITLFAPFPIILIIVAIIIIFPINYEWPSDGDVHDYDDDPWLKVMISLTIKTILNLYVHENLEMKKRRRNWKKIDTTDARILLLLLLSQCTDDGDDGDGDDGEQVLEEHRISSSTNLKEWQISVLIYI